METITTMDLTFSKRLPDENVLHAPKANLRLFIEHAPAAIAMFDLNMRYLAVSRRWLSDYKLTGEIIGRSQCEIFPKISAGWKGIYRRCLAGAVEKSEADRFEGADGTTIWLKWEARPWFNDAEKIGGIVIFSEDITEKKQAEEKVRQSEQRLHGLIVNQFSFVGLLEKDGTLAEVNRTVLAATNTSLEDVIGKNLSDTYWWAWSESEQKKLRQAIKSAGGGERVRYDAVIRTGEDHFTSIDFHLMPILNEAGAVTQLVLSAVDITERLQLESKLMLTANLSFVGEIAAGLAHEIKNPLAGIQGAIDVLIKQQKQANLDSQLLKEIRREIVRIDEVVHSLLDRAHPREMSFAQTSLRETVNRAAQIARHQIAARQIGNQIKIDVDLPPESLVINHDAAQIEDAVLNLIINSIDAIGSRRGVINVRLFRTEIKDRNEIVIKVTDTGCGIAQEEMANLFTPFYTTKKIGTGLGLSAVKRIAAAHGGYCIVNSAVNIGTNFSIRLPV